MKVLEQAARRRFEDEMVVHSKEFSPRLCEVIGEEQLRVALRGAMARAANYGFTYRGPIRLFIEMIFLFGSAFDTDPQYPWAAKILRTTDGQMQRAEQIYAKVLDYLEKVSGPEDVNTRRALGSLRDLAQRPVTFSTNDFVPGMLREIQCGFPQKADYIGDRALTALIREGCAEARKYCFPLRGEALVVTLMFAFGLGCTDDPLYPWISNTFKDERIMNPTARTERLERKAVTWLEHVLASPMEGAQT